MILWIDLLLGSYPLLCGMKSGPAAIARYMDSSESFYFFAMLTMPHIRCSAICFLSLEVPINIQASYMSCCPNQRQRVNKRISHQCRDRRAVGCWSVFYSFSYCEPARLLRSGLRQSLLAGQVLHGVLPTPQAAGLARAWAWGEGVRAVVEAPHAKLDGLMALHTLLLRSVDHSWPHEVLKLRTLVCWSFLAACICTGSSHISRRKSDKD